MPETNPAIAEIYGKIGARRRWQPGSSEEDLLADLEQARLDDQIDGIVAKAPEMTPEQADRIRAAFGGGM